MLISELAKRSGLPIDTIRFYEKKGLIDSELINRKSNNYRDYSEASLERLVLIQRAKRLGFTLTEIQDWIKDFENDQLTVDQKRDILSRKLGQIDERIEEMKQMRQYLLTKIEHLGEWDGVLTERGPTKQGLMPS
ncbi:MerR family transcriptional regulator [Oscillatoria sp. FACHB-1407]|uniref:MerR family transcriptional regulator n=1 Tax=Oscillatoria sp. FACHB-1407 TaxID=2692847 RepID=UPI0018F0548F|nr:MerR family transcriptional regulator [Oscillatoria sp. FACHB-1407]